MTGSIRIPLLFDPAQTLDCGQAFRWHAEPALAILGKNVSKAKGESGEAASFDELGEVWEGVAGGRYLRLRCVGDSLELFCSREEFDDFWKDYFDLDRDYAADRAALAALHPLLEEAAAFAPGIRILRQDPWEALCSFLISQNNNIPRIRGIIETLCRLFGGSISDGPCPGQYAFPGPERLAALSPEDLAPLRAGYRARYLIDAARKTAGGELDLKKIARSDTEQARCELQRVMGVGPKVAECVLLFGFHRTECFPMDVWMKRAMAVLLPGFSPADFGENAGLAQQYIFHYSRNYPELFQSPQ